MTRKPARPDTYTTQYREWRKGDRKTPPRPDLMGLTKAEAKAIRDSVTADTPASKSVRKTAAAARAMASVAIPVDVASVPVRLPEPGFTVEDTVLLQHAIRALVIERVGRVHAAQDALDEATDLAARAGVEV